MFRGEYGRLRFEPRDGMEVLVRGRVSVFETRGALQLYADELEPRGVGALQIAFEQLKQRLAAEGLFDRARKRSLPYMPRTVGIVTARRGAGLRDMMAVMLDRFPGLQVIVRPAKVQGDGAAREIAEAIADLNRDGRADVLIVGRGGGSLEDLWAFNEEAVARAIAGSAIPVISAVGHEIDYTIADLVADARAPTPTAAAHLVVPSKAELSERVASLGAALEAALERELAGLRETIAHLTRRVRHPRHLIVNSRQRLDDAAQALATAASRRVGDARRRLRELARGVAAPSAALREARLVLHHGTAALRAQVAARVERAGKELGALAGRLDSLSPLRVLERGYAVVVNRRDGRAVLDASTVSLGDELDVRVARGRLAARTTAREV
jgi:exodeoxyribonuclease VII large subunit